MEAEKKQFLVREDGSEVVRYNAQGYPLRSGRDYCLSWFATYAADCHWHTDFEFVTCQEGGMTYKVDSDEIPLEEGDVLFVNARRLHYGFSRERRECRYAYAVLHPSLLSATEAVTEILAQLSADAGLNYWHFRAGESETRLAQEKLLALCDHSEPQSALEALAPAAELMAMAVRHAGEISRVPDPAWPVVRKMIGYIQDHYREKITLAEIAAAGAVCRSRCCALFREKLDTTPVAYITRHRLNQACAMLAGGATITEAAFANGFQSTSFFSETFRKVYGLTPTEWRKQISRQTFAE